MGHFFSPDKGQTKRLYPLGGRDFHCLPHHNEHVMQDWEAILGSQNSLTFIWMNVCVRGHPPSPQRGDTGRWQGEIYIREDNGGRSSLGRERTEH